MIKKVVYKCLLVVGVIILLCLFFSGIGKIRKNNYDNNESEKENTSTENQVDEDEKWDQAIHPDLEQVTEEEYYDGFKFEENQEQYIGEYVKITIPSGFEAEPGDPDYFTYRLNDNGNILYYISCFTEDRFKENANDVMNEYAASNQNTYGIGTETEEDICGRHWRITNYPDGTYKDGYSFVLYETIISDQYISIGLATNKAAETSLQEHAEELLGTISTDFQ